MSVREFLGLLGEEILDPDEGLSFPSLRFMLIVFLVVHMGVLMGFSWDYVLCRELPSPLSPHTKKTILTLRSYSVTKQEG